LHATVNEPSYRRLLVAVEVFRAPYYFIVGIVEHVPDGPSHPMQMEVVDSHYPTFFQ
jgi:hypothetical protein